ncbi:hypothetical protein TELCIR_18262 [Teladorsagia circumcincta]|uniref:Neurotransmitter-gated ion-channel transmembrane domain-containing protein n=1 Tax=Teladorsagia circumcincta TaxID=45464 RepID=A0A2G9TQG6_TELCI|nr:hypothetical protein TELCIR_18262 [Teladorsagia circumcincta]
MALSRYCLAGRSEPIPLYMDDLLHAGRRIYDKHSPPVQEAENPTIVRLAMYIEGMSSFRTQTMDFQLDVYFQQFWKDPRLAHNETRFSFWLDVDAVPARVSLAITTLLTLSTQANAARMALPEVSYMKAIDVWMGACMM